jgi:PAS domain S-box-containing protein
MRLRTEVCERALADAYTAATFEEALHVLARHAREIIGAHHCALSYVADGNFGTAIHSHSFSKKYEQYNTYDVMPTAEEIWAVIVENKVAIRMTQEELLSHPRWRNFSDLKDERGLEHPPMRGWLAVPIVRQTGDFIGVLQLSDKYQGDFSEHDEDQLARFATLISPTVELHYLSQELLKQNQSLRQMSKVFMDAADPIDIEDLSGRIQNVNEEAERAYGWTREELIGQSIKALVPTERHWQIDELLERCRRGENVRNVEGLRWNKAKEVIPVLLTLSLLTDESGAPVGIATFAQDITELKVERRSLEQKAAELARSNQELDHFAYIVSHDLKEPLRGIHNYSNWLLEDYASQLDDDGRKKLETLPRLTQRMDKLIDALLRYSQVGRLDLAVTETNLEEVLAGVLDSLRPSLEAGGVDIRIPQPLPKIRCDPILVGELFHNLVTNAVKYNDKPQRWIEIGSQQNPSEPRTARTSTVFHVRDNGIGIRERHLPLIFRIFKRLHARDQFGGGAGAGLTIVNKIVERHGGRIWVDSEHGEGTTVYFTLGEWLDP